METLPTMDYVSKVQNYVLQNEELKKPPESIDLLEALQSSSERGRVKTRYRSGGSISDDDIPSVHKSRPIQIDVKGKKVVYDLISYQGVVSPEAPNDDFGFDMKAKKELKSDRAVNNEDIFTNKAVLAAFAHKKLKALRNSLRRERKRTVSSGSESTCSEPTRRRLESQSSLVLKLTERDDFNRDVIEGFLGPIKLPPKKQRTLSTGDENVSVETKAIPAKTQRSRSHGHLGQTVPVTIKIPTVLAEPWKGAWDNTLLRIVEPNDTLASVAAHFDITPSELAILNRLPSRTVFPGQVIRVPDKRRRDQDSEDKENKQDNPESDKGDDKEKDDKSEVCDEEMDMLEKLRLTSPKPGHAERVRTPLSPTPDTSHQRFLKINVRHITDGQGVVSGVLLVTSNAVMFDPNVSDPLVIEHGPESYGVIAPMEYVVNVAIYHDIAHMRVGSHDQFRPDWPKPEVYHLKEPFPPATDGEGSSGTLLTINQGDSIDSGDPHHSPSAREDSLLAKDETFPELRSSTEDEEEEDAGSLCSCSVPREGDAFPKAFDRDLVTPTNLSTTTEKQESEAEDPTPKNESVALIRSLEERRKSSLDHHWAVPSKVRSLEEQSASVSDTQVMDNNRRNSEGLLVKLSCHDSGIDIRDPPPVVPQVPRKSTYSDADVLLSDEFVPPVPIQPLRPTGAAVSFSLDQSQERSVSESHDGINLRDKDDHEKETKKNKMLKRLSYPLSWMEGLSGDKEEKDSLPSSAESHPPSSHSASSSVFSKVFSRRSSVGTFIRQQHQPHHKDKTGPKLDYRSMVSVEDMPELFVSFDKLIPRPAQSCDDPPLYLRLRMGKPKDKKIPKSTPIMSYGKKKMRPEYWFSVPRERVDDLYRFLMVWVPQLYGDLDETTVADRGYELVDSDTELWETEDATARQDGRRGSDDDDIADLTRESWEVLSMSEELRRALYASSSLDLELCLPDLNGVTEILSEDHRKSLCRHLPARAEGYVWTLVFSTSQHGFSLNSMYRKMTRIESPILMVIQDTDNNVFGALTSCALKMSDHFYGTGESLLFRFAPECQVYNWTGDNLYFIKGNNESLSIGAGDGKFGLWLDGDLYQGRTEPCNTYGNDPLTPSVDFVVKTLECWAFI
ncbi:nuclear receptor coactivator 7-like isoform X3 [Macrosteles quadrilineatus]|uniref:nuclear receptor coactivator 7-like isoform X3 n=1 Tax=Macrosteles quadrilineatus TaxID=74068 RepID=UPI0023E1141C|nr:nuclear receptor coactivator 7-like isoform X3 [Macrosteles quadrilineatus]